MKRSIDEPVLVTVARGRSIQVGDRLYLPGEQAPLSAEDAEHVRACGFVHDPDEPPVIRSVSKPTDNPASIGLQATTER